MKRLKLSITLICLILILLMGCISSYASGVGQKPVVFATDEMIQAARERIAEDLDPWAFAWARLENRVKNNLNAEFNPYMGPDYDTYWKTANRAAGFARDMAFAYRISDNLEYAEKAKQILLDWALVEDPKPAAMAPINRGLVIARATTTFCYAYSLVYDYLDEQERAIIEDWFALMAVFIKEAHQRWIANNYYGQQEYQNHLGAHIMGLGVIGFTINDKALISYALDSPFNPRNYKMMIEGAILLPGDELCPIDPTYIGAPPVQAGEIYDRYRVVQNSGLHYTYINLKFLTLLAEAAYNNGIDLFSYVTPSGKSLELAHEFYADFYITGDSSIKGGYYKNETVSLEGVCIYEIVHRRYPDNAKIKEVLQKCERVVFDGEQLGWTTVLTHGVPVE